MRVREAWGVRSCQLLTRAAENPSVIISVEKLNPCKTAIMSEFKDRIRFLRDEFSQEDRRGGFDDFGMMKRQLLHEFFDDDPFFMSSTRVQRYAEKQPNIGSKI